MGKTKELGITGVTKMAWKLLRQPTVARELMKWDRMLKEGRGIIGYGYFVARKVAAASSEAPYDK